MRVFGQFIIATLAGLVLAGGVHIAVILATPYFAEQDAFAKVTELPPAETAQIISAPGGAPTWLPKPDPAAAVAACPFDLDMGPMRVAAKTGPLLTAISFHTRTGDLFFAVTDKAAARGQLELVVMTQHQLDEARADDDPNDPSRDVRIVAPGEQGYVVVRVVAPTASLRAQAQQAAQAVSCTVDQDEDEE